VLASQAKTKIGKGRIAHPTDTETTTFFCFFKVSVCLFFLALSSFIIHFCVVVVVTLRYARVFHCILGTLMPLPLSLQRPSSWGSRKGGDRNTERKKTRERTKALSFTQHTFPMLQIPFPSPFLPHTPSRLCISHTFHFSFTRSSTIAATLAHYPMHTTHLDAQGSSPTGCASHV